VWGWEFTRPYTFCTYMYVCTCTCLYLYIWVYILLCVVYMYVGVHTCTCVYCVGFTYAVITRDSLRLTVVNLELISRNQAITRHLRLFWVTGSQSPRHFSEHLSAIIYRRQLWQLNIRVRVYKPAWLDLFCCCDYLIIICCFYYLLRV
jgi:hypothetical protein